MIRIETSRQTVVTFKTEKGALNRVARDAEWFANAAEAGTTGVVEVSARYDQVALRTLFDVDYVVYAEVAAEDVPEGAQGQVSGTRRNHLGKAVPYGYAATVVGLHECGRLRLLNHTGTLVQREDEVLTLLPGSLDVPNTAGTCDSHEGVHAFRNDPSPCIGWSDDEVTDLHLEDGSCCDEDDDLTDEDAAALEAQPVGCECPVGERDLVEAPTSDPALPPVLCDDCGERVYGLSDDEAVTRYAFGAGNTSASSRSSEVAWWVKVGGEAGDSTTEVASLPDAVTLWQDTLETHPMAEIQILTAVGDGPVEVYADVVEHDSCGKHDAVFSKHGPCPVCVTEDEQRWEDDPAGAERDADRAQAEVLRAALVRYDGSGVLTLGPREIAALQHAIYVLEG